jgi:hypothetical protein
MLALRHLRCSGVKMSKAQNPHTWSEAAAIAWIRTRDEKIARKASGDNDIRLEARLAYWENAGKSLPNYNLTRARDELHAKVGEGSIRKFGYDYLVEDVVRKFPRDAHAPMPSAEVHDKQSDTSKVKVWVPKPEYEDKLTPHNRAILQAVNELWPNGQLDHKAKARDDRINKRLEELGGSRVHPRTIQRTLQKIRFG